MVAEEVRNLARRSAEAAKTTADLIEGSHKNAEAGVAVTAEVAQNAAHAEESASASGDLSNQVQELNAMVEQLLALMGGRKPENGSRNPEYQTRNPCRPTGFLPELFKEVESCNFRCLRSAKEQT